MAGGRQLPPDLHRGRVAPGAEPVPAPDAQPHLGPVLTRFCGPHGLSRGSRDLTDGLRLMNVLNY